MGPRFLSYLPHEVKITSSLGVSLSTDWGPAASVPPEGSLGADARALPQTCRGQHALQYADGRLRASVLQAT